MVSMSLLHSLILIHWGVDYSDVQMDCIFRAIQCAYSELIADLTLDVTLSIRYLPCEEGFRVSRIDYRENREDSIYIYTDNSYNVEGLYF